MKEGLSEEKCRVAIQGLRKNETIKLIVDFLEKKGELSLCFPKVKTQEHKIHFIIENDEKRLTLFDASIIERKISGVLEYKGIVVELRRMFSDEDFFQLFDKLTPFSEKKSEDIKLFLSENYPCSAELMVQPQSLGEKIRDYGLLKVQKKITPLKRREVSEMLTEPKNH